MLDSSLNKWRIWCQRLMRTKFKVEKFLSTNNVFQILWKDPPPHPPLLIFSLKMVYTWGSTQSVSRAWRGKGAIPWPGMRSTLRSSPPPEDLVIKRDGASFFGSSEKGVWQRVLENNRQSIYMSLQIKELQRRTSESRLNLYAWHVSVDFYYPNSFFLLVV